MTEMVPNPLRAALVETLKTVEPLIKEIDTAIDGPFQEFHSGKVWSGPMAKRFDAEFGQYRGRSRRAGEEVVADIRAFLARTPEQVTVEEAKAISSRYGLA
ncbi:hypothetical protein [Spongiactinospora sp. 9N601]|uniref:hypothetical protein n=1 Tax=Spongiactinospora sp. 9N601 TaxID=3375149 RepID=UPI0037B4D615